MAALLAPLTIGRYRNDLRVFTTVRAGVLLIAFLNVGAPLSYLVVSTNAALVDTTLAAWDCALGFDWLVLHAWLQSHPYVQITLHLAYLSSGLQMIIVVVFLGFSARPARLEEFLCLFILATLLVILASGPFPAAGAWKHYEIGKAFDLSSLSHFELLRNGRMREISIDQTQGLVSIPSLHAAVAVLLVYAVRGTILLPAFFVINIAMLASTPVDGGHYLVDVVAGVALAFGLIALSRMRSSHQKEAAHTCLNSTGRCNTLLLQPDEV